MTDPNKFWITNPKYNIIIANKGAEESLYNDKRAENIKTGELMDYLKGVKLQKYEVEIRDDGIYVDA